MLLRFSITSVANAVGVPVSDPSLRTVVAVDFYRHGLPRFNRTCNSTFVSTTQRQKVPRAGLPTRLAGFRVTEAERLYAYAIAKSKGLTFSDYLRSLVPGLNDVHASPTTEEATPTT